ncbi:tetratricopeptide repeat protein [Nostoc sp. MS1]|uniref:tetratricopeptide repeat protein n=1 Tax=Nostoc sp. MS1 TaxID=2764711 RepID=UPI001CC47615|nr:tetratricopeptide repeat protein [Nostoc sp. MS1]BCL33822.1 hypothetical protein NSMS1_02690 [Nostoc sp. MS1]
MTLELTNWDEDLPVAADEEYQALVRTLKFTDSFGLLFVRCSPSQGKQLVNQVTEDVTDKNIEVLELKESVDNLYQIIDELNNKQKIDILFITGLEQSFYQYEECKALSGWDSRDTHSYSWKGVPPVLINLNQQRERFREKFNICFVFLLPIFAIKYFIQRAPDFFDWRSGLFEFPVDAETLEQESSRILQDADYEKYQALTPEERTQKILAIQELIATENQIVNNKAELLRELGRLYAAANDYKKAIASYDQALQFRPNYHEAWNNRGNALRNLERNEEAIASYDQALQFKPDYHEAWNNRGNALRNLGRSEEAIASYDQALQFKPDYHQAWNNRGNALRNLGRNEEAIASFDQALQFKPDIHQAWYNRGIALGTLGRNEEAIASFDQALQFKPDYHQAWNNRGNALRNLGRNEEAIASFDQALQFKPDYYQAWYNRGNTLGNLGRDKEAIASFDQALQFKPDDHQAWNNRGIALGNLGRNEEAITSFDQALQFKPDYHLAWNNRGNALRNLGRNEEAIASFDQALQFKPDDHLAWYNKACCYALQGNTEQAIESLQRAINLNPHECRKWAINDDDFNSIKDDERFQGLMEK